MYLNPGLWQVNLERHLLPHEDVGVASLLEQRLQHVQLRTGKGRPFSSLFPVKREENQLLEQGLQHVQLGTGKFGPFSSLFPVRRKKCSASRTKLWHIQLRLNGGRSLSTPALILNFSLDF